jgi:hypothetical protein
MALGVILAVVLLASGVVVQSNTPDVLSFLGVSARTTTAQVFLTGAICTWALLAASWLLSAGIRKSRERGAELALARETAAMHRAARREARRLAREKPLGWDGMVAGWGDGLAGADSAAQSAWLDAGADHPGIRSNTDADGGDGVERDGSGHAAANESGADGDGRFVDGRGGFEWGSGRSAGVGRSGGFRGPFGSDRSTGIGGAAGRRWPPRADDAGGERCGDAEDVAGDAWDITHGGDGDDAAPRG